jgi:hypothetical protein
MTVENDNLSATAPDWLGYAASVTGGHVGYMAAYMSLVWALNPLIIRAGDCELPLPQCYAVWTTYYAAYVAVLVWSSLVGGVAAGALCRALGSGAALETGIIAIAVLLCVSVAAMSSPWVVTAFFPVLATCLVLSRWLGVRWHTWRNRAGHDSLAPMEPPQAAGGPTAAAGE